MTRLRSYLIASVLENGSVSAVRGPDLDPEDAEEQKLKVVLCGDRKTGKTKLFDRISRDSNDDSYLQTIGSDFVNCKRLVPGANVCLELWDTGGSPEYRTVLPFFFHNADIVLIIYDVTEIDTFSNLQFYLRNVLNWAGDQDVDVAIVGSKIDHWTKERVVTVKMAEDLAQQFQCRSFEISSVTTQGIEEMLQKMLRTALKRKRLLPLWLMGSKATADDYDKQLAKDSLEPVIDLPDNEE